VLALLAGCYYHPHRHHPPGLHGPACADIHAATQIESTADRLAAFEKIAGRAELGSHEQMVLVDAVLLSGFSDDVLVTLIRNPNFYPEARYHLSVRLEEVPFSPEKKRVVDAMIEYPSK